MTTYRPEDRMVDHQNVMYIKYTTTCDVKQFGIKNQNITTQYFNAAVGNSTTA